MPDSDGRITSSEYYSECSGIARDVLDEVTEAQADGEERDIDETLDERIDQHQWIIYTRYNFDVLWHSDSRDSAAELGADSLIDRDTESVRWAVLAFYALRADVAERIDRLREGDDQ